VQRADVGRERARASERNRERERERERKNERKNERKKERGVGAGRGGESVCARERCFSHLKLAVLVSNPIDRCHGRRSACM